MAENTKNPGAATGKANKVSLMEKLTALTHLTLTFVGLSWTKDKDGKIIAILQLAEPLALVRGSQEVQFNGKSVGIKATDVREIKVHERTFKDNPGFQFDKDTDTGTFEGSDLVLDVAKSTGQVWLTGVTFAASGNEFRTTRQNERLGKLLGMAAETTNPADEKLKVTG